MNNRYKIYYESHKESIKNKKRIYYQKNKESIILRCKKWQNENKDKITTYNKEIYWKQREHILGVCKKYRDDNKEIICKKYKAKYKSEKYKIHHKEYTKNKYHTDPIYKIISLHRTRLWSALKSQCAKKLVSHSIDLFGCSVDELKHHLEKQLKEGWGWKNHGTIWHIDHIKPLSKFNLNDPMEQKNAFHYTNLQPLLREENIKKHNHLNWRG